MSPTSPSSSADNFPHQLRDCPATPNCVCSTASRPSQQLPPLRYQGTTTEALQRVIEVLGSWPRVKIVEQRPNYLHVVCTTRLCRFKDDLEILTDEAQRLLHYRSASRIGYSDLGANRRRLQQLVSDLLATGQFESIPASG